MEEVSKLRIAIDTSYMDRRPGMGTAIVIRHTVEELLKYRDAFDITLIHKEAIPEDPLYKEFKEVIIPKVKLPKFSGFFSELFFFLTTRERFDIYYFSYSRLYPTFWLAPARKIVFAAMDGGPQTAGYQVKAKGKQPFLVRAFFSRIAAFIALSEFGKRGIVETYNLPPEKVHVIYNGVDARFQPTTQSKKELQEILREKYQIPSPYILDVSRFDPHKNIIRLLEAYAALIKEKSIPEHLVFVGGRHTAAYSQEIDEAIEKLGLSNRVYVAPFIKDEDLPKAYAGAELMAFPSLYEGFGLPVLEAMACGVPVVISNIDALTEIAGGSARVVDPYATDSIKEGIWQAIEDTEKTKELAAAGLQRARDFTWESHGRSLVELFRAI